MMWSSLTPYCHCKEPLEPGKYLIGCLLPGTLLGLGIYLAAFLTEAMSCCGLSLLNVLGAGGDLLIAWYARRYRTGYCARSSDGMWVSHISEVKNENKFRNKKERRTWEFMKNYRQEG